MLPALKNNATAGRVSGSSENRAFERCFLEVQGGGIDCASNSRDTGMNSSGADDFVNSVRFV